jgi:uncharacterized lipoprotein YajG
MKKLILIFTFAAITLLSGCQAIQDQAENLRKQGENTMNGLSQQAENVKTQVIQTKQKYDEKSQEVVNAANALNKLTQ